MPGDNARAEQHAVAAPVGRAGQGCLAIAQEAGAAHFHFNGPLTATTVAPVWDSARRAAAGVPIVLDLTGVTFLDTAGAVLLLHLADQAAQAEWVAADAAPVAPVLDRVREALPETKPPVPPKRLPFLGRLGRALLALYDRAVYGISFVGELLVTLLAALLRPARLRPAEILRHLDEAGTRAFPLVIMLGFLIGLILAFQSAAPLQQFGATNFIPNLVGISLTRELAPLMAGVVLAGRTGSAFAAELGTMRVNEEVDALTVMAISPMRWLVMPRVIAAFVVMPVLSLLMLLSGLFGMLLVAGGYGIPPQAVYNSVQYAVVMSDLLGGVFKSAIFGLAIALIGCRAGLAAGNGPRAVGDAATSAVVGGIVAIVVLDGLFAMIFTDLGM